jgi:sugar phosphate permease
LLGASSIFILNFLPNNRLVLPVLILSVCSFGLVSANFWTLAQNVAPPQKVGRVIGFLNTISQVGGIAAPLITGRILGPAKDFPPAIAIAGICPLIALIPLFVTTRGIDRLRGRLHGVETAGALNAGHV